MFLRDPCGIVCIFVTYLAVFYADYVVTRWIILQTMQNRYLLQQFQSVVILIFTHFSLWAPVNVVFFNTIVFLLAMAHVKACILDPGTVPLPSTRIDFSDLHSNEKGSGYDQDEEWSVCTRCETYRPPRAHHCRFVQNSYLIKIIIIILK